MLEYRGQVGRVFFETPGLCSLFGADLGDKGLRQQKEEKETLKTSPKHRAGSIICVRTEKRK
ncbi:MAG: hypothetical protein LBG48_00805 [Rickettsiales bacterium]|jgi:hypothetical protein|nr:hypothetical protein [Rickettsiales bacterium]